MNALRKRNAVGRIGGESKGEGVGEVKVEKICIGTQEMVLVQKAIKFVDKVVVKKRDEHLRDGFKVVF